MLHNAEKSSRTHADLGRFARLPVASGRLTGAMTRPVRSRYPVGTIFMPADPVSAEILDLTHCGNILTRRAAADAHCIRRLASRAFAAG